MRKPAGMPPSGMPCHETGCPNLSHKVPNRTHTTNFKKYVLSDSITFSYPRRLTEAARLRA